MARFSQGIGLATWLQYDPEFAWGGCTVTTPYLRKGKAWGHIYDTEQRLMLSQESKKRMAKQKAPNARRAIVEE
jgi:hypothetical protein